MSNCTYLGTWELDDRGVVRLRRPQILPSPARSTDPVAVPASVARDLQDEGDIVVVSPTAPHPIYGDVEGVVWRFHRKGRHAFLSKDNGRCRETPAVHSKEIIGVVIHVIPRGRRDPLENYEAVQMDIALAKHLKREPFPDVGFYSERTANELRRVIEIPASELIGRRLPWGLFRGTAKHHHPHVGIAQGDTLTIDVTPEGYVGVIAIERSPKGTTIIGRIDREGLDTEQPGEFFIDLTHRRALISHRGLSRWRTIATVQRIEPRSPAASRRIRVGNTSGAVAIG